MINERDIALKILSALEAMDSDRVDAEEYAQHYDSLAALFDIGRSFCNAQAESVRSYNGLA